MVLSSGFLSFANHSGFLLAIEEEGLEVTGVMGTSAGALSGSLYCAGMTPRQVRCTSGVAMLLVPGCLPSEGWPLRVAW